MEEIRKKAFSTLPDIEGYSELINLVKLYPSHSFLSHSNAFLTYVYLVNYVCAFSTNYFKKPIDKIKILDWGSGKGHVTYLFKKKGADSLVSCDIDEARVDSTFGQETPIVKEFNIEIVALQHEYLLPFEDGEFDVVLSFGVLEHVSKEKESLKEINRVLTRGGLFFCFNLPYYLSYTQRISHLKGNFYHDRLYSKRGIKNLIAHSGFELIDIWFRNLFPKNSIELKDHYKLYEHLDQFLISYTPLRFIATSIEFVANKGLFTKKAATMSDDNNAVNIL